MAGPGVRRKVGLLVVTALGLLWAPRWSAASAESRSPVASAMAQITLATTIVPRTSTTKVTTTTTAAATTTIGTTSTTQPRAAATTLAPATVATTAAETTTIPPTTLASIPAPAPAPVTLPLGSASQSGSIGSLFPILGGIGLLSLVALLIAQWFLTKPGRQGPTL